jgi:hypothetical protein
LDSNFDFIGGSMASYSKFLKILISFSVALSPVMFINSANASTLAGGSGWRVASTVANGIGVTVNGAKDIIVNGAKKTATGVANVTPTASQVGKFMRNNLGAAAVVTAMDLLLDGVDYVLDPANNSVTYKSKQCSTNCQYLYQLGTRQDTLASTQQQACNNGVTYKIFGDQYTTYVTYNSATNYCVEHRNFNGTISESQITVFPLRKVLNPSYDNSKEEERKSVPLSTIGQQVIDQAETEAKTGNPAVPIATPVTQAAATAVVGEAETDETQAKPIVTELDSTASIPTTETAEGTITQPTTDTSTGEVKPGSISLDFPVFCSWAPSMCVMADNVQQAIADAREWVKESEVTDTELDFPEVDQQETDTDISFNASCPSSIKLASFNYHGKQQDWEVDFQDWCQSVTTYIRPIVISMGAFSAVLIVSGVRINE